jgi:hypothetical protein
MTRGIVPLLVAWIALSSLSSRGEETAAPPDEARQPRTVHASVFWDSADGQQKALKYIQSREAHQDAIGSLQQCRSCHDGLNAYVDFIGAAGHGLTLVSRTGPWVGVSVGPADDVLRAQLKLPEGTGVVVTKVVPGAPAEQSGVAEHDILLSVNGQPVAGGDALDAIVQAWRQDAPPLTLRLLREGQPLEKQVTPTAATRQQAFNSVQLAFTGQQKFRIGLNVSEPDETLRKQLKLGETGLVVTAVAGGSPAEKQGVKANDVLVSANKKPLKDGHDLTEIVQHAAESPIELELLRGGVSLRISVTPEKDPAPTQLEVAADWVNLASQQRELMLVHPGLVYDFAAGAAAPATEPSSQPAPAATAPESLDRITSQLEELRNTVESLRNELKQSRNPPEEKR